MRALVTFGSTRGGTAGLAAMVANALAERGFDVELAAVTDLATPTDLTSYDAVIVGGALYHDRWHPDATRFVTANLTALRPTPTWFFSSGPLDDSARSGALAAVPQVSELARRVDVRGHVTFGGVLEPAPGFFRSLLAWGKPGDFRDAEHVVEWVDAITARLGDPVRQTRPASRSDPAVLQPRRRGVFRRQPAESDEPIGDDDDDLGLDVLIDDGP